MSAVSHLRSVPLAFDDELPAGLVEQVAEAVTSPSDRRWRAVVIAGLAEEIFESLRWLHGSDPDREELSSLYRVVAEAHAHRDRMAHSVAGRCR